MIEIENVSSRIRSWRAGGENVWVDVGETITVDAPMPSPARVKAFAASGLMIRPFKKPKFSALVRRRPAPPPPVPRPSIPKDWRAMPLPIKLALASQITGKPIRSETAAVTIIVAELGRAAQ